MLLMIFIWIPFNTETQNMVTIINKNVSFILVFGVIILSTNTQLHEISYKPRHD